MRNRSTRHSVRLHVALYGPRRSALEKRMTYRFKIIKTMEIKDKYSAIKLNDKNQPETTISANKIGPRWNIIKTEGYSEKGLTFLTGIPYKITGYIFILQDSKTGKLKQEKVILNKVRIYNENTYVPGSQTEVK